MKDMNYYDEKEIEQEMDDIQTGVAKKGEPVIVYEHANEDSDVVCVLEPGEEVEIDESYLHSKTKFLRIYTSFGQEGYCMKRLIEI